MACPRVIYPIIIHENEIHNPVGGYLIYSKGRYYDDIGSFKNASQQIETLTSVLLQLAKYPQFGRKSTERHNGY